MNVKEKIEGGGWYVSAYKSSVPFLCEVRSVHRSSLWSS